MSMVHKKLDNNKFKTYSIITMQATIISIGNSRGIRIPKPLLDLSGIGSVVDIFAKKGEIKIISVKKSVTPDYFAQISEVSFAKDWLRPEEEEAWKAYQSVK
jgi:antitoxin component of MazEF toxin-antitoxin module